LTVKNWAKFQHYKQRRPPWIKLHRELLDDYRFTRLPIASRALAPCIWLLASESDDGSVTGVVEELAFRLRCSEAEVLKYVKPLIDGGFISGRLHHASELLAERKQHAMPEESREETEESREENAVSGGGCDDPETAFAREYLKIVSAVFGKKRRVITPEVKEKLSARSREFEPWQILSAPILIYAQGRKEPQDPDVYLRDGKNPRTRDGNTYGGYPWISKSLEKIDGTRLDGRLTQIARESGLLEKLEQMGVLPHVDAA